jgi:hypothetical protein
MFTRRGHREAGNVAWTAEERAAHLPAAPPGEERPPV